MKKMLPFMLLAAMLLADNAAAVINFTFDDHTYEGWQDLSLTNPQQDVGSVGWRPIHGYMWQVWTYKTGVTYAENEPHPRLLLRSPEFKLTVDPEDPENNALRFSLAGGIDNGADVTGKLEADMPVYSLDDATNPVFPAFMGVALRNVNTGTYVLSRCKTVNSHTFEQFVIGADDLLALDQEAVYTLDLIDVFHGGWGHVKMDNVTIPGEYIQAWAPAPKDRQTWVTSSQASWSEPTFYAADSYNVYLSQDPNVPDSSLIGTVTEPTIDLGPLGVNETWYWRVDSVDLTGGTPSIHKGQAWSFTTVIPGDVINVDLGDPEVGYYEPYWNTIGATGGSFNGAVTGSRGFTPVRISIPVGFNGTNTGGATNVLGYPARATGENFWADKNQPRILFSNLDPALPYALTFFGSRMNATDNREAEYTITGKAGAFEKLYLNASNNTSNTAVSQTVYAADDGTINIDVKKGPNSTSAYTHTSLVILEVQAVDKAVNPTPANTATGVQSGQVRWYAPTNYVPGEYNVYLSQNAAALDTAFYATVTETSVDFGSWPEDLGYNTTWYWRVDCTDPNDGTSVTHKGDVWSFTTIGPEPIIHEQPITRQMAAVGDSVTLSIGAECPLGSTLSYQWYRGEPGNTISPIVGATDATVVFNAASNDFGPIFCRVSSPLGGAVDSEASLLAQKRLLAHYEFEQNGSDSVGSNNGTAVNGMSFVEGLVGSFAADPNGTTAYLVPGETAYPRAGYANGLETCTYSVWLKADPGESGYVFGAANEGYNSMVLVQVNTNGTVVFKIREDGAAATVEPVTSASIQDGQWHHIAAVYDGAVGRIFIDGYERASQTKALPNGFADWDHPLALLANCGWGGEVKAFYNGSADDLRIYNYAMDRDQVIDVFHAVTGEFICIEAPEADWTGDCKVDLDDIAFLASQWLQSGLYPAN